jgi:hypothetical protein
MLLLVILATCLLAQLIRERSAYFELRMELKVDRDTSAELFYDSGPGFNRGDSHLIFIRASGEFQRLAFRISSRELRGLRFDPCDGECMAEIRNAEIISTAGRIELATNQFAAANEIESIKSNSSGLRVHTTSRALDPQLKVTAPFPMHAAAPLGAGRSAVLLIALVATVAALCLIVFQSGERPAEPMWSNAWLFPAVCTVIAITMSVARLNGSSSAMLARAVDGSSPSAGVLLGTAKSIRSDEWMVHTPWLLSQTQQPIPFPSHNLSVGDERAPLVCNLPVAHWSAFFRPELWPFFARLPFELAFAFFWNFKWWSLVCGSYTLLMLVARGRPAIAAAGALMLLWTSTIQWWFSSPTLMPDMIGLWCFAVAAAVGAIVHPHRFSRILLAAAFVFCALGFAFCCYPRFQVPLITLSVPLGWALLRDRNAARHWVAISAASLVILAGAALFFWQVRETVVRISGLVYPGQTFSTGGGAPWSSVAEGFLTLGMSEFHYPIKFDNVVAAASLVNPLPLLACLYVARFRRGARVDLVQFVLLAFGAFAFAFATIGIPAWLAKASLWSYVTTERTSVALAIVSTCALCRYLSSQNDLRRINGFLAAAGVAIFALVLVAANRNLGNFVTPIGVAAIGVYYSATAVVLAAGTRFAAIALTLFPLSFFHVMINPLSRGVPAYQASSLSGVMHDLHVQFPGTKWIVFGSFPHGSIVSGLLKTTGANVGSGVIAVPDRKMLHRLDRAGESAAVYSRYAAVNFLPGRPGSAAPVFHLQEKSIYSIELPLTDGWLRAAGVDGVLVLNAPALPVPDQWREIASVSTCRFWVRSPQQ